MPASDSMAFPLYWRKVCPILLKRKGHFIHLSPNFWENGRIMGQSELWFSWLIYLGAQKADSGAKNGAFPTWPFPLFCINLRRYEWVFSHSDLFLCGLFVGLCHPEVFITPNQSQEFSDPAFTASKPKGDIFERAICLPLANFAQFRSGERDSYF